MHYSFILSLALLGTTALTAPHAAHHHKARDTITTWTKGNDVYVEDIHVVTAVLGQGQAPPTEPTPTSSQAAANIHDKFAYPGGHGQHDYQHQSAPVIASSSSSAAAPVLPVITSTLTAPVAPSSTPETTAAPVSPAPASSDFGSATGTGPAPGPSNINIAGSSTWSTSPNSMGKSVIGTANYWRTTWNSALGSFEWNATLAGNARSTAIDPVVSTTNSDGSVSTHNEGGANQMNHMLNPGSMAQCINEGDGTTMDSGLTPFEQAWLGWLCERPNSNIPCDKISETGHYAIDSSTHQQETGHADIIAGSYTQIGCYYQDGTEHPAFVGMWTCDFA